MWKATAVVVVAAAAALGWSAQRMRERHAIPKHLLHHDALSVPELLTETDAARLRELAIEMGRSPGSFGELYTPPVTILTLGFSEYWGEKAQVSLARSIRPIQLMRARVCFVCDTVCVCVWLRACQDGLKSD